MKEDDGRLYRVRGRDQDGRLVLVIVEGDFLYRTIAVPEETVVTVDRYPAHDPIGP